jgi:hypothetical protein
MLSLQHYKQNGALKPTFLQFLVSLSHAKNFVETGTYYGDSTKAAAPIFENIYSIELSPEIHKQAKERLKEYRNVNLYMGDSKQILPLLLFQLDEKTIFFLDGHYSCENTARGDTDTPIIEELIAIKNSKLKNPIIIIDDIRFFTRHIRSDYPSLADIEAMIKKYNPNYNAYVVGDMLLAFHDDEPFTVSPVIQACTISRMADEYKDSSQAFESILYRAEQIIAQAENQEQEFLLGLFNFFEAGDMDRIGWHYRLWAGLIELNLKHYESAKTHFETALRFGFNHERVHHYLELANNALTKQQEERSSN